MTIQIQRSALLPYSAAAMYDLINDVLSYPQFLPWCSDSEIIEQGDGFMRAGLTVAKGRLAQRFVTKNILQPNERISMNLEEGPFRRLQGTWEFTALNDNACKISLDLEFDYAGPIIKATLGPLFTQAANTMVDAFCKRANEIYG